MRTGGGHHRAEKEGGTVWLQETGRCLERERSSPHSPAAAAAAEPLMLVRSPNEEARSCGAQRQAAARSLHHPFPGGRGSEGGRETVQPGASPSLLSCEAKQTERLAFPPPVLLPLPSRRVQAVKMLRPALRFACLLPLALWIFPRVSGAHGALPTSRKLPPSVRTFLHTEAGRPEPSCAAERDRGQGSFRVHFHVSTQPGSAQRERLSLSAARWDFGIMVT